jgi:hypothetical protein
VPRRQADHRGQALDLELARLDQLQSAFYPAAMAGDIAAATFVLKPVVDRRCAIMGFDKIDDEVTGTARGIVISGTSEEYVAGLKALVGEDDSRDATR